jgi:lipopolysaccharide transport system permease protein
LIWRFFLREFSARYRQTVFGYLWALLPAVLTVVTFTYLNKSGAVVIRQTEMPYPVYVLLGVTVWQLFATGLIRATQSLVNSRAIITQINFSRETLVIAAFVEAVLNFVIRLVLIVIVFMWFKVVPMRTIVFVPFVLIPLALMTIGFGFIFALANGIFRDIGNSLTLLLTFAMFLSPVVYPPASDGSKVLLNYLNPISPFIIATRDLAVRGYLSQPWSLFCSCVFGVSVFLICWRVFHLAMPRIAERV